MKLNRYVSSAVMFIGMLASGACFGAAPRPNGGKVPVDLSLIRSTKQQLNSIHAEAEKVAAELARLRGMEATLTAWLDSNVATVYLSVESKTDSLASLAIFSAGKRVYGFEYYDGGTPVDLPVADTRVSITDMQGAAFNYEIPQKDILGLKKIVFTKSGCLTLMYDPAVKPSKTIKVDYEDQKFGGYHRDRR